MTETPTTQHQPEDPLAPLKAVGAGALMVSFVISTPLGIIFGPSLTDKLLSIVVPFYGVVVTLVRAVS